MFFDRGSKEEVQQCFRVSVCPSSHSSEDSKCQWVSGFFPTWYLIKILTRVMLLGWKGGQIRFQAEKNFCIWMLDTQIIPSWLHIYHLQRLFYFSCTPQYELCHITGGVFSGGSQGRVTPRRVSASLKPVKQRRTDSQALAREEALNEIDGLNCDYSNDSCMLPRKELITWDFTCLESTRSLGGVFWPSHSCP